MAICGLSNQCISIHSSNSNCSCVCMANTGKSYSLKMLTLLSCPLPRAGVSESGKYLGFMKGYDQTFLTKPSLPLLDWNFPTACFRLLSSPSKALGEWCSLRLSAFSIFWYVVCSPESCRRHSSRELSLLHGNP